MENKIIIFDMEEIYNYYPEIDEYLAIINILLTINNEDVLVFNAESLINRIFKIIKKLIHKHDSKIIFNNKYECSLPKYDWMMPYSEDVLEFTNFNKNIQFQIINASKIVEQYINIKKHLKSIVFTSKINKYYWGVIRLAILETEKKKNNERFMKIKSARKI
jgi:hypothetical protein